ncbi:hypothetical protein [Bacillus sp. Cs-700]|uniref:hypothetical protein n=1 Tax=Bacillus sp. Cs-700 TaxID=2589818 RepID=UPI00140E4139|nr:hypothetical protein [Bacillus sp. Cs-700]
MNTVFVFGLKGEAIEDLATAAGSLEKRRRAFRNEDIGTLYLSNASIVYQKKNDLQLLAEKSFFFISFQGNFAVLTLHKP